jgi:hypothetical protein
MKDSSREKTHWALSHFGHHFLVSSRVRRIYAPATLVSVTPPSLAHYVVPLQRLMRIKGIFLIFRMPATVDMANKVGRCVLHYGLLSRCSVFG